MSKGATLFKETRTYDQVAKKYLSYQTAVCSECGAFENYPIKSKASLPPDPLIKVFQRRGWVMGSTRKHDVCPDCVKEMAEAKRKETPKEPRLTGPDEQPQPRILHPIATAQIIPMTPKEEPPVRPEMTAAAQPPRQPQREDKRLIILEIENHYLGADKGYSPGSSDETVAKSLNVPVKWVADLREDFFGPVLNPEIAKLTADVAALTARMDAHEREGRELRAKLMEIKERLVKAGGRA